MYLIGMLVLLFLANVAMLLGMTNWPQRTREGFADRFAMSGVRTEPFMDYLSNGFATAPIGSYDGVNMAANLPADSQGFRARMPNVPHPTVTIDNDHLLPFVHNECKPECCGSTMSCDGGGCVCTTPEDRDLINTRGGNRRHEDGF
jgi:hypothetical protein